MPAGRGLDDVDRSIALQRRALDYVLEQAADLQKKLSVSDRARMDHFLTSARSLEKRVAETTARHVIGKVPRPPHWSGFRLQPLLIEFWQDGAFRLHDRLVYIRDGVTAPWRSERLFP